MHAGRVGAVKSATVLCTAAIDSHSRNYLCFEPFLKFGSQRGFHPAVTEKHGGWNSSFLASPHSQAVLSCAIVGKHQLSRCLRGEGRGMFPVSGFFQISHHWSLTETPLFTITVILCCQVVMQKCLCRYFYMFTVLSGSQGLCKDGTCEFWVILWNCCIMNALIWMRSMICC